MNADEYIAGEEQKFVELLWSSRNVVTGVDLDFLADLKIAYGGCCGLELNASPAIARPGNPCIYCGKMSSHYTLYACPNRCKFGKCVPKTAGPARGIVYAEIVMSGASVRKAREMHALRRCKPLMGERRASGCGMVDLGEIA